ncbi:hypothetical protein SAY87_023094 [Trapa incisa]|uniref:Uncharacterized protein n=1 Tax=Trapa incisa TaxID=236973 RepID=A0AAN7Q5V4_9MYRT|nr:hypothetical protein SAY87_023094 [Trapa incisa]
MSSASLAGGTSLYGGFTKLCKGLAVVLVGGHAAVQIFPATVAYLALIPARYMPISGFNGVLAGLLVGIKQIIPDQELPLLRIKAKWSPSILLLLAIAVSFFIPEPAAYIPLLVFGTYMSWIYLRYIQRKPETIFRGDPSDDFSFASFFPEILRPIINPIASMFTYMLCGRSENSTGTHGYTLEDTPLPGSDPVEASRRRERGARALEERLAAERLAAALCRRIPERCWCECLTARIVIWWSYVRYTCIYLLLSLLFYYCGGSRDHRYCKSTVDEVPCVAVDFAVFLICMLPTNHFVHIWLVKLMIFLIFLVHTTCEIFGIASTRTSWSYEFTRFLYLNSEMGVGQWHWTCKHACVLGY